MFESKINRGKPNGYAPLDSSGKIPIDSSQINNFSRTITICDSDLFGNGTIEEKILNYLTLIDYKKSNFDGDVNIIVNDCDPIEINLDVVVYSGSVITVFTHSTSKELLQDVSLPVELQLGLTAGGTFNVPVTITIEKNTLSGETTVTSTEINYEDLSGTSDLLVGQLSVGYDYVSQGSVTFNIPISGGSGSGGSGSGGFGGVGIGLSLLD